MVDERGGTHEAKTRLSEYLNRVHYRGERIVIERHGRPVAALVSMGDIARLESSSERVEERYRKALAEAGIRVSYPEPGKRIPRERQALHHNLTCMPTSGATRISAQEVRLVLGQQTCTVSPLCTRSRGEKRAATPQPFSQARFSTRTSAPLAALTRLPCPGLLGSSRVACAWSRLVPRKVVPS